MALGYGGIKTVYLATGIVPSTIGRGLRKLKAVPTGDEGGTERRIREPGGGRRKKEQEEPKVLVVLEQLIEPETRGDPESPLRWTCKSLRRLSGELAERGYKVGKDTVGRLLKKLNYSLQANSKTTEGKQNPDRNAQFEYINAKTKKQLAADDPALSVDTKKKELVGDYKNVGRELVSSRIPGSPTAPGPKEFSPAELHLTS